MAQARAQQRPVRSRLGFTAAHGAPYVTYAIVALNVAAYLFGTMVLGTGEWRSSWALAPGSDDGLFGFGTEPLRWVTSAFLHFGWLHLAMNMFVLWQFGSQLEPAMGRLPFTLLYLVSMLGGSAGVVLLGQPDSRHGGASGAVFGVLAAYVIVLRMLRLNYQQVAVIAGVWLVAGFFVPGLSWEGHLGGAIGGAVAMTALLAWVRKRSGARRR